MTVDLVYLTNYLKQPFLQSHEKINFLPKERSYTNLKKRKKRFLTLQIIFDVYVFLDMFKYFFIISG